MGGCPCTGLAPAADPLSGRSVIAIDPLSRGGGPTLHLGQGWLSRRRGARNAFLAAVNIRLMRPSGSAGRTGTMAPRKLVRKCGLVVLVPIARSAQLPAGASFVQFLVFPFD